LTSKLRWKSSRTLERVTICCPDVGRRLQCHLGCGAHNAVHQPKLSRLSESMRRKLMNVSTPTPGMDMSSSFPPRYSV